MDETIGARLRRLRTERHLSQRQLATANVSYAFISRIESGDRNPSIKALRELAQKLGVTPLYLEFGNVLICPHCQRPLAPEAPDNVRGTWRDDKFSIGPTS